MNLLAVIYRLFDFLHSACYNRNSRCSRIRSIGKRHMNRKNGFYMTEKDGVGMNHKKWNAVIFDMDGVLIDSEPLHAKADRRVLAEFGVKDLPGNFMDSYIGSTLRYVAGDLIRRFSLPITWQEYAREDQRILGEILEKEDYPPVPYVVDLIRDLHAHGIKLAVASSSLPEQVAKTVRDLGTADCFDVLVDGTMSANPKPAPDIFLLAARMLGEAPENCIVVEDSHNGALAGKAAGMMVFGYLNPHSGRQDLSAASVLIESFEEVNYAFCEREYDLFHGIPMVAARTARLEIRELTQEDIPDILDLYREDGLRYAMDQMPESEPAESEKLSAYIRNQYRFYGYGLWGIFTHDGRMAGYCGIQNRVIEGKPAMELSYLIHRDERRKGYGTEAVEAVLTFAEKVLGIRKVSALIDADNTASRKLAEHVGMVCRGTAVVYGREQLLYELEFPETADDTQQSREEADRRSLAAAEVKKALGDKSPVYGRRFHKQAGEGKGEKT